MNVHRFLGLSAVTATAALLAVPGDGSAGPFHRRAGRCQAPCPAPCASPYPVYSPAYPLPYPPVAVPPTQFAPAAPGVTAAPAARTIVTPKGRRYRLIQTADRGREQPDEVVPPTPVEAADPNAFVGVSRRAAKTSYVTGEPTAYASVTELRAPLQSDAHMVGLGIPWGSGSENSNRVDPEKKNVTVLAYLYAFKEESDHDYHLIIGDAPDSPSPKYINSEVSGLPGNNEFRAKLKDVRDKFKTQFGLGNTGPAEYVDLDPPIPVRITGSLFYDMDHAPPRPFVGHGSFEPMTAWEIHPITEIEFDPNP